jgi:hypothetical protein
VIKIAIKVILKIKVMNKDKVNEAKHLANKNVFFLMFLDKK